MAGRTLMEPEERDRIGGMGGIISEVASYRNYKNAIGFSFRYYSTEMVQNGDIRLLSLNGVEPTTFAPNTAMTRAMLVTVLYRAAGSPEVTVSTNFTDLNVGDYYYSAVVWANSNGIVNGVDDTHFAPDSPVTRQQIAAILYRYAKFTGNLVENQGSLDGFVDKALVEPYAVAPMAWAVGEGIISGTTNDGVTTTLSPLDHATRAQVAVMLHRYLV